MTPPSTNLRTLLTVSAALTLGYTAHSIETALRTGTSIVEAQSRNSQAHSQPDEALAFQLSGITPAAALTVYNPADHTLYVYPAVTEGNSHINCSFMLHLSQPGAAINRKNCTIGSTLP